MSLGDLPTAAAYFGGRMIVNSNPGPRERLTKAPLFTQAISSGRRPAAILIAQLLRFSSQSLHAAEIPVTIRAD
jgi:hypothetical protein